MIFVDTGFLFALFVEGDVQHHRVREVFEPHRGWRLRELLLTTNHVVAETVTLLAKRGHPNPGARHALAVRVGRQLYAGAFGRVHYAEAKEEHVAFAYFEKRRDKGYSFVDCLSFVIMEKSGIHEAWAVDRDFTHRFHAVPGPLKKSSRFKRQR